jgi:hypothetical protein
MNDPRATFPALCPVCGKKRFQEYRPENLAELLAKAAPIKAWCHPCNHHWLVGDEDRANIANAMVLVDEV